MPRLWWPRSNDVVFDDIRARPSPVRDQSPPRSRRPLLGLGSRRHRAIHPADGGHAAAGGLPGPHGDDGGRVDYNDAASIVRAVSALSREQLDRLAEKQNGMESEIVENHRGQLEKEAHLIRVLDSFDRLFAARPPFRGPDANVESALKGYVFCFIF